MPKIYTKTGDKGETGMLGGRRVSKSCLEIEVIGEVDETNAMIGLLVSYLQGFECEDEHDHNHEECGDPFVGVKKNLLEIQNDLFVVGSNLAALQTNLENIPRLSNSQVLKLETWIDKMEKDLPKLKNFILPGGDMAAVQSYTARAVCRRAERCLIGLSEKYEIEENLKQYINRLSDYLFVLARWINMRSGIEEVKWEK